MAISWVTTEQNETRIISMSLGGGGADQNYKVVIDAAVAAGVVVVVAAGNSNADACNYSPAFTPKAITVASSTNSDARSGFSNFGPCIDIYAPGSSITSCGIGSDTDEAIKSGTSMACPHVAGMAAILMSWDPLVTPAVVVESLTTQATNGVLSDAKEVEGTPNLLLYMLSTATTRNGPHANTYYAS